MKKLIAMILTAVMILSLGTSAFAAGKDSNLGTYYGTVCVAEGIEIEITEAWPSGFNIELQSGGRCILYIDGEDAGGKWNLTGDVLKIKCQGEEFTGTLSDGVLSLINVQDSGVDIYFYTEDAIPAETPAPAAEPEPSGSGNSLMKQKLTPSAPVAPSEPSGLSIPLDPDIPEPANWWCRDWYGFWLIYNAAGEYEDMDGQWWDTCAAIEYDEGDSCYVTLWDEDSTYDEPFCMALVNISPYGRGDHGTMYSSEGFFYNVDITKSDWVVDPANASYDNMIEIDGSFDDGEGSFDYVVVLRPWGTLWDDIDEEDQEDYATFYYEDWYLPLLADGVTLAPNGEVGGEA